MQKAVITLTVLIFICASVLGLYKLFFAGPETKFETVSLYAEAKRLETLPKNAPDLPLCAKKISSEIEGATIRSITFICDDAVLKDAYITKVRSELVWNVLLFDPNIVVLSNVKEIKR